MFHSTLLEYWEYFLHLCDVEAFSNQYINKLIYIIVSTLDYMKCIIIGIWIVFLLQLSNLYVLGVDVTETIIFAIYLQFPSNCIYVYVQWIFGTYVYLLLKLPQTCLQPAPWLYAVLSVMNGNQGCIKCDPIDSQVKFIVLY